MPKRLAKIPEYGIRGLKSWNDIYAKIQKARENFDSNNLTLGRVKNVYRRIIDNSDVVSQVLKVVPGMEHVPR